MPKFEHLSPALERESEDAPETAKKWWNSQDPWELAWGQLSEPVLMIGFEKFRKAVEEVLGRPVAYDELREPEVLKQEMMERRSGFSRN